MPRYLICLSVLSGDETGVLRTLVHTSCYNRFSFMVRGCCTGTPAAAGALPRGSQSRAHTQHAEQADASCTHTHAWRAAAGGRLQYEAPSHRYCKAHPRSLSRPHNLASKGHVRNSRGLQGTQQMPEGKGDTVLLALSVSTRLCAHLSRDLHTYKHFEGDADTAELAGCLQERLSIAHTGSRGCEYESQCSQIRPQLQFSSVQSLQCSASVLRPGL